MKFIAVLTGAALLMSSVSSCEGVVEPRTSVTIKPPKYSERPKNKDKRHSNSPQPRHAPKCTPGDERIICPR